MHFSVSMATQVEGVGGRPRLPPAPWASQPSGILHRFLCFQSIPHPPAFLPCAHSGHRGGGSVRCRGPSARSERRRRGSGGAWSSPDVPESRERERERNRVRWVRALLVFRDGTRGGTTPPPHPPKLSGMRADWSGWAVSAGQGGIWWRSNENSGQISVSLIKSEPQLQHLEAFFHTYRV